MIKRDLSAFIMNEAWFAPFYYRKANDQFDEYFSGNGYYPYDEDYNTNVRVNLKVFLDENGRVNDMSYYKVYDFTQGHGKPVTRDADLTPFDEKKLASALSLCTISTAEEELNQLLEKATGEELPGGWIVKKSTKKSVSFADKKGNETTISRARIVKAIDISHAYLDIINVIEFWQANSKCLNADDAEPLMALFSLIDTTQYYAYDTLIEEEKKRINASEEKSRIKAILVAAEYGDTKTFKKEIKFLPNNPTQQDDMVQSLFYALSRKDEAMARLLIQKGTNINLSVDYNGKRHGIMEFVIKSELDSIVLLCLRSGFNPDSLWNIGLVREAFDQNRPDYAIKLLNAGAQFLVFPGDIEKVGLETICKLAKYIPRLEPTDESLPIFYKAGKISFIKRFITHLSGIKDFKLPHIVHWLLDTGDIRLMQLYCDQGYPGIPPFSYFHLSNTTCFSHPWSKFYTGGLFKDERTYDIFLSHGIDACTKCRDIKGLIYLFDEMHVKPKKEQMELIALTFEEDTLKHKKDLFKCMLGNLQFINDNSVWVGADLSPEETLKRRIEASAELVLLRSAIKLDNHDLTNYAIDTQYNLLVEPGAFYSVYNAIKNSKHDDLRNKIYQIIKPAAQVIIDNWSKPRHFAYTYGLDAIVNAAKEFFSEEVV